MKIAIIDFGHVDSVISLAKYLGQKAEVDLYLTFTQESKSTSVLDFRNKQVPNGLIPEALIQELLGDEIYNYLREFVKINVFIFNSLKLKDPKNITLCRQFSKLIKNNNYDIVNFNGNSAFELPLHFLLRNVTKVHTIHDVKPHTGEGSFNKEIRTKILSRLGGDFILQSKHSKKDLTDHYFVSEKNVYSTYYGPLEIYAKFFESKAKTEVNNVLFFGRISPYKGIEYLLEAVKLAKKKIENISLTIAGGGKFYFDISSYQKNGTYKFINRYIPNSELVELIKKSSLVVCPYTDATQSGVVMTSYALGKPVIASNVGGIPEVVKNNVTGILVPPKDPSALSDAIVKLLTDNELYAKMVNNLTDKSALGELAWENIADKTLKIYNEVIAKRMN